MDQLSSTGHSLPPQSTSFIGRKTEITEILTVINDPTCRLLTLVGPGGVGKTRLAIEVVSRLTRSDLATSGSQAFRDGAFFVTFAPLHSSASIVPAIADSVRLQFSPSGSPREQLVDYLRTKSLLLVMDNFEHLLNGADLIPDILSAAPGVVVLVTSRERLKLQEEWVWEVKGLSYPDTRPIGKLDEFDATQLFVKRASQVRRDFSVDDTSDAVARICQLVEGMPLALELAASWCGTMPVMTIASQILKQSRFSCQQSVKRG